MPTALIAGPCVSEFGWELLEFQGHIRALANQHDHVVVCSTEALRPLYADFKPIFVGHKIRGTRDCHIIRSIANPEEWDRVMAVLEQHKKSFEACGCRVRWEQSRPSSNTKAPRRPIAQQLFVQYGTASNASKAYSLVIHARDRQDGGPCGGDNYPVEAWNELLKLLISYGLIAKLSDVAAIGLRGSAIAPSGVDDLRDSPLQTVMDLMAAAKVVLGPSSGPMHLASLCGTPHFTWATDRHQSVIGGNNRDRYLNYWNPLKTPAFVMLHPKGRLPEPNKLAETIRVSWKSLCRKGHK